MLYDEIRVANISLASDKVTLFTLKNNLSVIFGSELEKFRKIEARRKAGYCYKKSVYCYSRLFLTFSSINHIQIPDPSFSAVQLSCLAWCT